MRPHLRTRTLPPHPDLDHLKRQAKDLLAAFRAGSADAVAEVGAHYRGADPGTFALHDAQLTIARAYGFDSWPKLKAFVDGATVQRLIAAVRDGREEEVRRLLDARPELARMSHANLGVLHHAVFAGRTTMVGILMAHGANARDGVYPHREATTPYAIAEQRGCTDMVRIIEAAEAKRRDERSGTAAAPPGDKLFRAISSRDYGRVVAMLDATPALVHTRHSTFDVAPIHVAAGTLDPDIVRLLLERGADPATPGHHGLTPLDAAAHAWYNLDAARFAAVADLLRRAGAPMTAAAAAALGDAEWLRARHAEGRLENQIEGAGGLLRIAASHNRPDILNLLLEFGLDPDERIRAGEEDEHAESWGMPLQHCAGTGKYEMAELLLQRGADPNARIYASGDPMFSAFSQDDSKMVALLERYGGIPAATSAGLFRRTELGRRMLNGEARFRLDGVGGDTLPEQLLWGAACGGDPELVRLALERVDWPREDPRWFTMLEQPLRTWTHGSSADGMDPTTYLTCFRLLLGRCDPDVRGRPTDDQQFGLTTLHNIVARGDMTPDERVAFASAILDAGARLDLRDHLLKSTPLGWACRWGVEPLVRLFLERGADPVEADAEPWATPRAWAERTNRPAIAALLDEFTRA